jgi:alpha-L-rhamnosidase
VLAPVELRTELLVDPLGLDTTAPRLSWRLAADGARGMEQAAYQVVVSGDAEWDSSRVEWGDSLYVPYAGEQLRPGARCTWRVRVWDREGGESDWSEPAAARTCSSRGSPTTGSATSR